MVEIGLNLTLLSLSHFDPLASARAQSREIQYLHKNLVSDNLLQFDFNKVTDIYLITYSSRPRPVTGIWMLGTTHQTAKFLT